MDEPESLVKVIGILYDLIRHFVNLNISSWIKETFFSVYYYTHEKNNLYLL